MNIEQFILKYNIENKKKKNFNILGKEFIKNNKNKIKLSFNNKKFPSKSSISTKEFKTNNIKIRLLLSKNISNRSCMFKDCSTLTEINHYNDILFDEEMNNNADNINNEIVETNCKDSLKKEFEEEINNNCYNSKEEMIQNYNSPIKIDKNIYNNIRSNNSTFSDE